MVRKLCPRGHIYGPPARRCPVCAPILQKQRDARRGTPTQRGYDATYRHLRVRVLERDGRECVYCGRPATQVDHVIPLADGGTNSMDNLVASCRQCNASRGGRMNRRTP